LGDVWEESNSFTVNPWNESNSFTVNPYESDSASVIVYDEEKSFAGYGSLQYGASRYGDSESYLKRFIEVFVTSNVSTLQSSTNRSVSRLRTIGSNVNTVLSDTNRVISLTRNSLTSVSNVFSNSFAERFIPTRVATSTVQTVNSSAYRLSRLGRAVSSNTSSLTGQVKTGISLNRFNTSYTGSVESTVLRTIKTVRKVSSNTSNIVSSVTRLIVSSAPNFKGRTRFIIDDLRTRFRQTQD